MNPEQEQEYLAEAERMAELPREVQRKLIGQHRAIAADKAVPKSDRKEAKERGDADLKTALMTLSALVLRFIQDSSQLFVPVHA
jgi:hypothetical protein